MISLFRPPAASTRARPAMARPVDSARPARPTFAIPSFASLVTGTRFVRVAAILDGVRSRQPALFWSAVAGLAFVALISVLARPATAAPASALEGLGGSAAPAGATAPSLVGGSIDPLDLVVKGGLVVVLLFVTLKVMRRLQGGETTSDSRIRVLETRTLAAKTQLHLVAVGDRQVLIGATPGRLVTLAEIPVDEPALAPATTKLEPLDDTFAAALLRESGLAR